MSLLDEMRKTRDNLSRRAAGSGHVVGTDIVGRSAMARPTEPKIPRGTPCTLIRNPHRVFLCVQAGSLPTTCHEVSAHQVAVAGGQLKFVHGLRHFKSPVAVEVDGHIYSPRGTLVEVVVDGGVAVLPEAATKVSGGAATVGDLVNLVGRLNNIEIVGRLNNINIVGEAGLVEMPAGGALALARTPGGNFEIDDLREYHPDIPADASVEIVGEMLGAAPLTPKKPPAAKTAFATGMQVRDTLNPTYGTGTVKEVNGDKVSVHYLPNGGFDVRWYDLTKEPNRLALAGAGTAPPPPMGKGGLPKQTLYGPRVTVKPNPTVSHHKQVYRRATTTARAAFDKGSAAIHAGKSGPMRVHGDLVDIVGVVVAKAGLSPKQKAAVQKHDAAKAKTVAARVAAAKKGQVARKSGAKVMASLVRQHGVMTNLRTGRGAGTRVHGDFVGLLVDIVGDGTTLTWRGKPYDQVTAADIDQMSDDEVQAYSAWFNGLPAATTDGSGVPDTGGDPTALPPAPPMDRHLADMDAFGGILYTGNYPGGSVGSYGYYNRTTDIYRMKDGPRFDGTDHYGFIFGSQPGVERTPDGSGWMHVHGGIGRSDWYNDTDLNDAVTSWMKNNPNGVPYGPLVGNPASKDFATLRCDDKGRFFWLPQEAPDSATFPAKQAAALTAAATAKAASDAAAADAARIVKEQADAAEAQAQADAANALAQSQESSAAAIAASQQSTQDQAAASALAQQQAQLDMRAQEMQLQAQQQQLDWLSRQPDPGGGGGTGQQPSGSPYDYVDSRGVPTPPPSGGGQVRQASPIVMVDEGGGVLEPPLPAGEPSLASASVPDVPVETMVDPFADAAAAEMNYTPGVDDFAAVTEEDA